MAILQNFGRSLNNVVAQSPVGYYFHLEGSGHVRHRIPYPLLLQL